MSFWNNDVDTVWDLLQKQGYVFDLAWECYVNKDKGIMFTNNAIFMWPGDVKYYLETGFIRNIKIFDSNFFQPKPADLGLRQHKDGRPVAMKRIK